MIIDYEEVGARMKARRLFLGLSLNEAGKRMGVTATTLKRWEDGYVKSIKTTKMLMIANALETTPEALFGMEEKVLPIDGVEAVPAMHQIPLVGELSPGRRPSSLILPRSLITWSSYYSTTLIRKTRQRRNFAFLTTVWPSCAGSGTTWSRS